MRYSDYIKDWMVGSVITGLIITTVGTPCTMPGIMDDLPAEFMRMGPHAEQMYAGTSTVSSATDSAALSMTFRKL